MTAARAKCRSRVIPRLSSLSAVILAHFVVAFAHAAEPGSPSAPGDSEDTQAHELEKVEVVGSRIKRVDLETSQPIFTLERADIDRTGLISVGDVLQQIVFHGEAINTRINNGGDGSVKVSLRNLGPNRTLVLVNGRRWVSTIDGDVDLTQIPLVLVERIEVLKDGASAIYGSDAIAGVVNITTRKDYEGSEAGAYYGQWEQGDGATQAYDFTWGKTGERGGVAAGVAYNEQDPVFARDRPLTAVVGQGLPTNDCRAGASGSTPNGRFRVPGLPDRFPGQPRLGRTLIEGRPGTSPDDFRLFDRTMDCYNFAPANYLLTPQERTSAFAQARYSITGQVEFSADMLFNQRRSSQLLAPGPLFIDPGFSGPAGNVGISADNLYNPFDQDIEVFSRRFVESGGRRFSQDLDTVRVGAGFDGLFDAWDRSFAWDAHAIYTRSQGTTDEDGVTDLLAVASALGPSFRDAQGVPRCGTPDAVIAGCVPLNVFGGAGTITPEMAAYISAESVTRERTEQRGLTGNLTSDLFELPHGPVGFAIGLEHRKEEGENLPSALSLEGRLGTVSNNGATSGSYSVNEGYVEFNVPVLAGVPGARLFDLNIAARYSDYSNFGSTTNAKFGFRWKPHEDLLFRGNWAQGFRAPSISELFLGSRSGNFDFLGDPCQRFPEEPPASADTLARCAALGVPAVFDADQLTNLSFGGNPELQPETAVTKTLGLVYGPHWLEGINLYLDWYKIEIADLIAALGAQAIVDRCYVLGEPASCARVTRAPEGHLFLVDATRQNLSGGLETEGFDFGLDWRRDTRYGKLGLRWDTAYVDYYGDRGQPARLTRHSDGTLLQGNRVGAGPFFTSSGAEWRIKSSITLDWSRGAFGASITGRYFSELDEDCQRLIDYADEAGRPELYELCDDPDRVIDRDGDGIGDPAAENQIDATWYFDLQLRWNTPWEGAVQLGVNDMFNQGPPVSRAAFSNSFSPAYEIPGRYFYVGYRQRF